MPSSERPLSELLTPPSVRSQALEVVDFDVPPDERRESGDRIVVAEAFPLAAEVEAGPRLVAERHRGMIALPADKRPRLLRRVFGFIGWSIRSLFGIASLILLLALIAAIPIVN